MAGCVVKGGELGLESGFPALGPVPPHPQLVPLATKRMDGELAPQSRECLPFRSPPPRPRDRYERICKTHGPGPGRSGAPLGSAGSCDSEALLRDPEPLESSVFQSLFWSKPEGRALHQKPCLHPPGKVLEAGSCAEFRKVLPGFSSVVPHGPITPTVGVMQSEHTSPLITPQPGSSPTLAPPLGTGGLGLLEPDPGWSSRSHGAGPQTHEKCPFGVAT